MNVNVLLVRLIKFIFGFGLKWFRCTHMRLKDKINKKIWLAFGWDFHA